MTTIRISKIRKFYNELYSLSSHRIYLALLILVNFLIRLPRVPGIIGSDAFIVLWMGYALHDGFITNWVITPFSFIGYFPFASYPIGYPLIVAVLINANLTYVSIALILSSLSCIIGVFGAYRLGWVLSKSYEWALYYTLIYSVGHLFLRNTYMTVLTRGLFMALLPWFLAYSISYIRGHNRRDGVFAFIIYLLLTLTHALSIFILLYVLVFLIASILPRVLKPIFDLLGPFYQRIISSKSMPAKLRVQSITIVHFLFFFIILFTSYIVGLLVVPIDFTKTSPFLLSNDTLIGISMNIVIDYGIRLGLFSIFYPIGVVTCFYSSTTIEKRIFHTVLMSLVMFTIPTSLYASVIFYPTLMYYSIEGFFAIRKKVSPLMITTTLVWFLYIFTVVYDLMVVRLPYWLHIIVWLCVGLWFFIFLVRLISTRIFLLQYQYVYAIFLIVLSVVAFSIVCTDGVILQNDNRSFMTQDELQIVSILRSSNNGSVFVCSPEVGRRLQAYGIPSIGAYNEDASLYFGWITPSEVIEGSSFDLFNLIYSGRLFTYNGYRPEHHMLLSALQLDLTKPDNYTQVLNLGIRWIVVEITLDGYSPIYHAVGGDIYSTLLYTTPIVCQPVYVGQDYALFAIP